MLADPAIFALSIFQIIWIDLLLSADNAIVIALACRNLPEKQRRIGLVLGAGTAVVLRIVFAGVITYILDVPYLRAVGAILLFWIAIKLVLPEEETGPADQRTINSLWGAVLTVAIADATMSLDNVIAVAAVADGSITLLAIGIGLSIPLLIVGSVLVLRIFERYPFLIWAGGGLLGWISGHLLATDIVAKDFISRLPGDGVTLVSFAGLMFVVVVAIVILRVKRQPIILTAARSSPSVLPKEPS
jgi:YjbE family integral membrane protein